MKKLMAFLKLENRRFKSGGQPASAGDAFTDGVPLTIRFRRAKDCWSDSVPVHGHGQETLSSRLFTDQVSSAHQQR